MNAPEWHSIIFTALFLLLGVGLVTLLFSRSNSDKIRAMPYAFVYGVGVVAWLASLVYVKYVADTFLAHRFSFPAGYVVTLGMLGLSLTYPNSPLTKRARWLLSLDICVSSVFIGLIFFTDYVLTAANFAGAGSTPISAPGKVFVLVIVAQFLSAIVIFVRRYLTEARNRLYFNYVVLAFMLLVLVGGTTNVILPLAGEVSFALLGPLCALLPFITIVYALGITDINDVGYVVAQLLKVGLRFGAVAVLFIVGRLMHYGFGVTFGTSSWVFAMAAVAVVGVVYFYLFGARFDRYVENKIAYAPLSPDEARRKLIVGLSGEIGLDRNVSYVLRLVKQTIGVRKAGIVLFAKDGRFVAMGDLSTAQADASMILAATAKLSSRYTKNRSLASSSAFPKPEAKLLEERGIWAAKPLRTESGISGLYLLGEKFSQEVFTRQDGVLMNAITEISDLSIERALFYDQIRSFNATLQGRVDDATRQLRAANKQLRMLDALKDDFISMASHQLRSPATAVRDAIKMLGQPTLRDQERATITELADASSERLVGVITDMLSVAQIQAGHFSIEKSQVNLAELVARAASQAATLASRKHIEIVFHEPSVPVRLQADRAKLNESIANYLENAICYSPEGSTITLSLTAKGNRAYFEVHDNGIGVPESERKDLFTKFYRASNAQKEQPNGNGVGLFVVQTVIRAHGGEAFYRPLEQGSTFGFWLPLEPQKVLAERR